MNTIDVSGICATRKDPGVVISARQIMVAALMVTNIIAVIPAACAQNFTPPPSPFENSNNDDEPEFLKSLPQIRSQPRSLFAPAVDPGVESVLPDEQPYFTLDRILDPAGWGQPGLFADAQIGVIAPNMTNNMQPERPVTTGLGNVVTLSPLGSTRLATTTVSRLEIGYRLPAGFGEIAISDTFFNTQGSDATPVTGGTYSRMSYLNANYTDLDYISREYTPSPQWEMKWRLGLRGAQTHEGTTATQSLAAASAGNQFQFQQSDSRTWGFGSHVAVELERRLGQSQFSLFSKFDIAYMYMYMKQRYDVTTTTVSGPGYDSGTQFNYFTNQVPVLNFQTGLVWHPANRPYWQVFGGYVNEHWWNVMANNNFGSTGEFGYQGGVFRASLNY